MVLPFARTQEGVEPLDSLRDAFEEQIGCFPESFGDVMRFYQSHIDQGVYRNCLFASDRRLRNLRHLLYSMMQRRTKAIADVFPEAVLVPWSSLSLVAPHLDSPARQALEACMPHVRKTSIPLVAEQICPIWPRPTAASILAAKRAEVGLSQQSVVPSKLGGSVALPGGKDLISPSRENIARALLEREGDVKAGHRTQLRPAYRHPEYIDVTTETERFFREHNCGRHTDIGVRRRTVGAMPRRRLMPSQRRTWDARTSQHRRPTPGQPTLCTPGSSVEVTGSSHGSPVNRLRSDRRLLCVEHGQPCPTSCVGPSLDMGANRLRRRHPDASVRKTCSGICNCQPSSRHDSPEGFGLSTDFCPRAGHTSRAVSQAGPDVSAAPRHCGTIGTPMLCSGV